MKTDDKKKLKDGIKGKDELDYAKEPADDKAAKDPDEDDESMEESTNSKFDLLNDFIDDIVNKEYESGENNISEFIKLKSKEFVSSLVERKGSEEPKTKDKEDEKNEDDYSHLLGNRAKKKAPLKKMKDVKEAATVDDNDDEEETEEDDKYLSNRDKKKAPLKKMKKDVKEAALIEVLKEFMDDESPIRLKGDDVFVNNKLVGTLENDLSNTDTGIVFRSTDGKGGKDFNDIKELYQFLVKKFEVNPESAIKNDEK